jgi:glutamate-1-semialdehyde 2,1-aminomutase
MTAKRQQSRRWMERSRAVLVGGVNSPVRSFQAAGGEPPVIASGQGAYVVDVDGNRYVDYVLSWGPLILGHANPQVVKAVRKAAEAGTSFGAPTQLEAELAELVQSFFPSMQRLRFVNSGTEACMSAVRLARAVTGRERILKFEGCYHGHGDSFLVKAGSGVATLGIRGSPGVPDALAQLTVTCPYNDLAAVEQTLQRLGNQVAAIIVEPVVGNAGLMLPADGFLSGLRHSADEHKCLLIFDEVMTGFRVSPGGAQARYGIRPDLTCLGKVIGGGLPVGAFGGRADVMQQLAPEGPVYQAGTLSGNPLAMAAGLATLRQLQDPQVHEHLEQTGGRLEAGLSQIAVELGIPLQVARAGSMWGQFFTDRPVTNFAEAARSDVDRFKRYFWGMLERGIYLAPSPFEAGFLSTCHGRAEIEATLAAHREVLAAEAARS